jgi:uncharacterized protein (DUF433 family)
MARRRRFRLVLDTIETDNRANDAQQLRQKGEPMDQAEALMQRHITMPHGTPDPHLRKEPFIRDKGTPVWVVVGYYLGSHSPAQTAAAFALTDEEVRAALWYYTQHKQEITQRIETSESTVA